ncbi:MAG: KTSC domain-containing protein [Chitinispirillales bacterium]|nr:KTSC domain-containing protein [Chitinispirillales bacterium]
MRNRVGGIETGVRTHRVVRPEANNRIIEGTYSYNDKAGGAVALFGGRKNNINILNQIQNSDMTKADKRRSKAAYLIEKINTHTPPSSVIEHIEYDVDSRMLQIKFVSGETYDYPGFTLDLLEQWATADSLGGYFVRVIRPYWNFGGKS